MNAPLCFLLGFLSAAALSSVLAVAYYVRARRRVERIKAAIENFQQARKTVGAACDKVYSKTSVA